MAASGVKDPSVLLAPLARRWILPPAPDREVVSRLKESLGLPDLVCSVLAVRGLQTPSSAGGFLRPLLEALHPPEHLPDAEPACRRIERAIERGETILIHGDYDVDGVCGAALLSLWLRRLGGRAVPFVPHRLRDGYDFGPAGLEEARRVGATLVVTVDSGTLALAAVSRAREEGIDVVVTDHHTPGESLPDASAIVNPHRSDSAYPDPGLCGTGVVFKICQLLAARAGVPFEELLPHLDLVALATVADLVPLSGENRILVRYGLRALRQTEKAGLRALLEVTGLTDRDLGSGPVGFVLAPRINAVGRLGEASLALRLLLADDRNTAYSIAGEMERINGLRQGEDRRTLAEALELLASDFQPERDFGVVLASEGWHPGVIGIVASRVVERIHRPTVLISLEGKRGRGSARSIPEFDLFRAVQGCSPHLIRFGGHAQAAGMDLRAADVDTFRDAFNAEARKLLGGTLPKPSLHVDLEIELGLASGEAVRYLQYMGPFGVGNRTPLFMARRVHLDGARVVGANHLKLTLRKGEASIDAIGFGLAEHLSADALFAEGDVLFQLGENHFRGQTTVQARVVDLRPAGSGSLTVKGAS